MLNLNFLQKILAISVTLSAITCTFVQKTKKHFKKSKFITLYSLIVNIIIGYLFCITFTDITFPTSLWVGLFSFLGADTIYKTLEGKIAPYSKITAKKEEEIIPEENIINKEAE